MSWDEDFVVFTRGRYSLTNMTESIAAPYISMLHHHTDASPSNSFLISYSTTFFAHQSSGFFHFLAGFGSNVKCSAYFPA